MALPTFKIPTKEPPKVPFKVPTTVVTQELKNEIRNMYRDPPKEKLPPKETLIVVAKVKPKKVLSADPDPQEGPYSGQLADVETTKIMIVTFPGTLEYKERMHNIATIIGVKSERVQFTDLQGIFIVAIKGNEQTLSRVHWYLKTCEAISGMIILDWVNII
jgi:hypothetical protein